MRKSENSLKNFFLQDTVTLAKSLLGKLIVTKDEKNNINNENILFIHTGGTPLFFNDLERIQI